MTTPIRRAALTAIAALVAFLLPDTGIRAQARPAILDTATIHAAVERIVPAMIAVRHDLHEHPELGNRETRTAGIVADGLRALGLEVRTGVAHTAVVGLLRGGLPGPVVAVRADMDALPVTEATDLPCRSIVRTTFNGVDVGVMHACGHDIHTSVLLGAASARQYAEDRWAGPEPGCVGGVRGPTGFRLRAEAGGERLAVSGGPGARGCG